MLGGLSGESRTANALASDGKEVSTGETRADPDLPRMSAQQARDWKARQRAIIAAREAEKETTP
jgi:hypothetical protein